MDRARTRQLLEGIQRGEQSIEDALEALSRLGLETDDAHIDTHRQLRTGHAEVVYGAGKTPEQVVSILLRLHAARQDGLVTRVTPEKAAAVAAELPDVRWHATPGILHLPHPDTVLPPSGGSIAVICAGTSDLPVAEEAAVIAEAFGHTVARVRDVGVAGLHRILGKLDALREADVLIVVAGMEGALPSVVAGLVKQPVIAVPTSVGYGANFGGIAALLGMLNSCASGVVVVNIDNGFGAAMAASRILRGR
jgi:NCAIR mutase (PurE)-related protein